MNALGIIAEKKGQALRDVVQAVLDAGGPSVIGTRAGYVKFHDDKVGQLKKKKKTAFMLAYARIGLNLQHFGLLHVPPCLLKQSIPHLLLSTARQRSKTSSPQPLANAAVPSSPV